MAPRRKSKRVKYYDFEFVATSVSDRAGRTYTSKEHFPRYVNDLDEIADFVFKFSIATDHLPRRVSIITHGSTTGFHVGTNYISLRTIRRHAKAFKKLGLLLVPGIASLELYSCQVGNNLALLRRISNLLDGVPVTAYEENQPASGEGRGPTVRCKLNQCRRQKAKKRRRRSGSTRPFD